MPPEHTLVHRVRGSKNNTQFDAELPGSEIRTATTTTVVGHGAVHGPAGEENQAGETAGAERTNTASYLDTVRADTDAQAEPCLRCLRRTRRRPVQRLRGEVCRTGNRTYSTESVTASRTAARESLDVRHDDEVRAPSSRGAANKRYEQERKPRGHDGQLLWRPYHILGHCRRTKGQVLLEKGLGDT